MFFIKNVILVNGITIINRMSDFKNIFNYAMKKKIWKIFHHLFIDFGDNGRKADYLQVTM